MKEHDMLRIISTVAILLTMVVAATAEPVIGLYDDPAGYVCASDVDLYVTMSVYVVADLQEVDEITAAEFYIENLPVNDGFGLRTDLWNTGLVIGTPEYGVALAFNPPLDGPMALLGQLDFFMLDEAWIYDDHCMDVEPSLDSGLLVVVDGNYDTIDAYGYVFNFNNTTGSWFCWTCDEITPTEQSSFSTLKSLY
jgi:hypothetical protein